MPYPLGILGKVSNIIERFMLHWKLDDTSGNAIDSEGDFDGTIQGATQDAIGQYQNGRSYNFDGTNDYVENNDIVIPSGSLSFSLWIHPDVFGATRVMMGVNTVPVANGDGTRYIQILDTGFIRFRCSHTTGFRTVTTAAAITTTRFWHIVGVKDDENKELRIYRQSVHDNTTTFTQIFYAQLNNFEIGRRSGGTQYFDGKLDDVRVYNYALTDAEVIAIFRNCDSILQYHEIILWLKLDDAGTALDYSPFGYHASIQSGPTTGVTGQIHEAFSFDGVNDYCQFNNGGFLTKLGNIGTGDFTIAFWFKTGSGSNWMGVFAFGTYDPGFYIRTGDRLTIYDDTTGVVDSNTTETLDDDAWHHAGFVRTGTGANEFLFYLDGNAYGTATYPYDIPVPTETFMGQSGDTEWFDGEIDDFRIYPIALTADEVSTLAGMAA